MLSSRTVRTNTDVPAFPSKTPGRDPRSRLENATTVRRMGKNPKTPLHPSSIQPKQLFKDQKSVLGTAARPLGDKTPLPNRLAPLILQSTQKKYETPMNHGNHWDVSDGDIDVSSLQPVLQVKEYDVEDDLGSDEIEFCPPNTLDLPYQPPFDFELPNYTDLGKTIRELAFSFPYDDASGPPEPDFLVSELEPIVWETFPLPPIESDDPFSLVRLESSKPSKASTNKPSSSQKTESVPLRRAQSSLARLGSLNNGTTSRSKPAGPSKNLKTVSNPAPVKKQPPKSALGRHPLTTTRMAKPTTIQKKTTAAEVHTTQNGPIRSQTRPHTSLSIPSKSKGASVAPKNNNNSSNQPLEHQLVGEDFMFDV